MSGPLEVECLAFIATKSYKINSYNLLWMETLE
jgi:hypothetical protein